MRFFPSFLLLLLVSCSSTNSIDQSDPFGAYVAPKNQEKLKQERKIFRILYTGNLQGEVGTCGCAYNPVGGIDRRLNFLNSQQLNFTSFDFGNMFFPSLQVSKGDSKKAIKAAKLLASVQRGFNVQAQNVGRYDLVMGIRFVQDLENEHNLSLVSTNIVSANNKNVFKEFRRVRSETGQKFFVMGFSSVSPADLKLSEVWKTTDPVEAAMKTIKQATDDELVVILSDLSLKDNAALASAIGRPSIVLGSSAFASFPLPKHYAQSVQLQPLAQGQEVGLFTVFAPEKKGSAEHWYNLAASERFSKRMNQLQSERAYLKKQETNEVVRLELERNERALAEVLTYAPKKMSRSYLYKSELVELGAQWAKPKNRYSKLAKSL